jgi:spore maturation protein CgeB
MKVLLCGYHNPHFMNTIVYREKALQYLGHELITFDDRSYVLPGRLRDRFEGLQRWDMQRLNRNLVNLVMKEKPEACVIVGGDNILPWAVQQIKDMGIPIGLWTTDVPINFDIILESAHFYSRLFCAGSEAVDLFHAHGLSNVTWLPFGCDPNYHRPLELSVEEREKYARDVIFVGSHYENRAKLLEAVSDYNIGVWGPYWSKLVQGSPLKGKAASIKMNYDQWVKIFNACKINLVIHYNDGKIPCHQASPKLFEAMACKSFVLTDRQKDVQALFKDKEHLVYFKDIADLREKMDYYLKHDDERMRIAEAGYKEVIARHTFQDRMKFLLDELMKTKQ